MKRSLSRRCNLILLGGESIWQLVAFRSFTSLATHWMVQPPWFFEFNGASATVPIRDDSFVIVHTATIFFGDSSLHESRWLLSATVEPSKQDLSADRYGVCTTRVIVCSFSGSCLTRQVQLALRRGSIVSFDLWSMVPQACNAISCIRTSLCGHTVEGLPARLPWQPVIQRRCYVVRPNVRKVTVRRCPLHIKCPSLCSGQVAEISAVSKSLARWRNGVVSVLAELEPFSRTYICARGDKPVRIRKYPHRNADIIGEMTVGEARKAVSKIVDPAHGEEYVEWESGGWSRVSGTGGPFLVLQQLDKCEVFPHPKMFTSVRESKGVRVRQCPNLTSKQIGVLEPNEVREAVASHSDEQGNQFIEWASGGFSCHHGTHGTFLVEVVPCNKALMCHPIISHREDSPEVRDLYKERRVPLRMRDGGCSDTGSEDSPQAKVRRTEDGISPSLVPQNLKQDIASGRVDLNKLPTVAIDGDDSDFDDSSDDYDEDAL